MQNYIPQLKKNINFTKLFKVAIILSLIIAVIDVLDLPSKFIDIYGLTVFILLLALVVILVVLTILENGFLDAYKIKGINQVDAFNYSISLSLLIYLVIIYFIGELYLYKKVLIGFSLVILSLTIITRIYRFNQGIEKAKGYKINLIDLKDLYENKINVSKDEPILISEKDVEYDLLNRGLLINFLYDTIKSINPDDKFVISLEGKWGSGKTTILNNVKNLIYKNHEDIIIIDEFDPWNYEDDTVLFEDMFNLILEKSGLKYKFLSVNKLVGDLSELVFGTKKNRFIQSLFLDNNIKNLKLQINDYLKLSEKKYVFIIDNIDRAEKENISLLFKIIGNILDFERITYILSYDDIKIKKIFNTDLNLDYGYLKKIINLPIRIPEMDKTILNNIYQICLKRILLIYGEAEDSLENYNSVIDFLCEKHFDIRDFKRFINTVINYNFKSNHYLNKKDMLIMELIKLNNYPLYQAIYTNKEYFISYDKIYDSMIYLKSFNKKQFNDEGKKFYDKLFSVYDNRDYFKLMEEIFPYVKKYNDKQDLEYDSNIIVKDPEIDNIRKEKGICSAKYFDLYFTLSSNTYVEIANLVTKVIKSLNKEQSSICKEKYFLECLSSVHPSYHKELIERLQLYLDEVKKEYIFDFIKILFNNIQYIDSSSEFFGLSATTRVSFIIYLLLNKISNDEYNEYLSLINNSYNSLNLLQDILYWFTNDKENICIDDRKDRLEETINNIANNILNKKIDLYSNDNYKYKNIHGLYNVFKDEQSKLKNYVESILNENNIYRFLYDIVTLSIGSVYRYSIDKNNLEIYTTSNFIDSIIKIRKPKSEDEEFILKIYQSFLNDEKDEWGRSGIDSFEHKKLSL